MDQRRSPFTDAVLRVIAIALLVAFAMTGLFQQTSSAQTQAVTINVTVHSCPADFTGTTDQQFLINCTLETGLYGVPLNFANSNTGQSSVLYSQPNGAGGALPMTLSGLNAGTMTISEISEARSPESVVFCTSSDERGLPIIESAQFPVVAGAVTLGYNGGWTINCNWYRYPISDASGSNTPTPAPGSDSPTPASTGPTPQPTGGAIPSVAASTVTINLHSCDDDVTGTSYDQFIDECTSENSLYGVPIRVTWPDGSEELNYSSPSGSGAATPLEFEYSSAGDWEPTQPVVINEIFTPRSKDPKLFCSQTAGGTGSPAAGYEEVPVDGLVAAIPAVPGDSFDCDWFRFPGRAAGINAQAIGGGFGMIVVNNWVCNQGELDQLDAQALPAANLLSLKASCQLADLGVSFFLDKQYILNADGTSNVGVAWWQLDQGEHTVEEFQVPGFGAPTVICEGNVPDRQYIQPNIFALTVTDLEVTYDLADSEILTCDWFNPTETGTNAPNTQTGGQPTATPTEIAPPPADAGDDTNDELTPDATVAHNGNDVFLTNDSDDDGLLDEEETNTYGTNPKNEDTDSDGLGDFNEIMVDGTNPLVADTDGDGLSDSDEVYVQSTDPLNPDTDGDGVSDGDEVSQGTDPLAP